MIAASDTMTDHLSRGEEDQDLMSNAEGRDHALKKPWMDETPRWTLTSHLVLGIVIGSFRSLGRRKNIITTVAITTIEAVGIALDLDQGNEDITKSTITIVENDTTRNPSLLRDLRVLVL